MIHSFNSRTISRTTINHINNLTNKINNLLGYKLLSHLSYLSSATNDYVHTKMRPEKYSIFISVKIIAGTCIQFLYICGSIISFLHTIYLVEYLRFVVARRKDVQFFLSLIQILIW